MRCACYRIISEVVEDFAEECNKSVVARSAERVTHQYHHVVLVKQEHLSGLHERICVLFPCYRTVPITLEHIEDCSSYLGAILGLLRKKSTVKRKSAEVIEH